MSIYKRDISAPETISQRYCERIVPSEFFVLSFILSDVLCCVHVFNKIEQKLCGIHEQYHYYYFDTKFDALHALGTPPRIPLSFIFMQFSAGFCPKHKGWRLIVWEFLDPPLSVGIV